MWLLLALVLGAVAGLLLLRSRSGGELTVERLTAARSTWEREAPRSYELELEMRGALNETRSVVVRDGRVVSMKSGGIETPEASWEYWSVDGLFDALNTELSNAADPMRSLGAEEVALIARFDPSWGYPSYFYRHIMGRMNDIEWEVVRFAAEP